MASTKHVGSGKTTLQEILATPEKETDLTIKLTHNKKKEQGVVKMHVNVIENTPPAPEPKKKPDPEPEPVVKEEDPKKNLEKEKKEVPKEVPKKDIEPEKEKEKEEVVDKSPPKAVVNDPPTGIKKEGVSNMDTNKPPADITKPSSSADQANSTPFDFETALLCIRKVSANHLKDVEKFGKNVRIEYP
mgnify:FL=1